MTIRTVILCEIVTRHEFFGGGRCEVLVFEPSPSTAVLLARQRMFFRRTPGGCVILVEVDPALPGAEPVVPIPSDLRFDLVLRSTHRFFANYTALDGRFQHFSNRRGSVDAGTARLHPGDHAAGEAAAVLTRAHCAIDVPAAGTEADLAVLAEDGSILASRRVAVVGGRAAAMFNLGPFAPTPFSVTVGGGTALRGMSDDALSWSAPLAVVSLTARPGTEELSLTDSSGNPAGTRFVLAFSARATIWRYTVITRTNAALDHTSLLVEDLPPSAGIVPLDFSPALPKAPLPTGEPAVVIESAAPIPLRSTSRSGLRLSRRVGTDIAPLLNDLPNPSVQGLSPASTPGRLVSEIFLYV